MKIIFLSDVREGMKCFLYTVKSTNIIEKVRILLNGDRFILSNFCEWIFLIFVLLK